MGTKLQHKADKLATRFDFYRQKGKSISRVFNNIQHPVNTIMLQDQHKESIKKTMLMHEDVFRQQVRELHRLYRVQRSLMDNHSERGTNICSVPDKFCLQLNSPSFVRRDPLKVGYGIQAQNVMDLQRSSDINTSEGVRENAEDQIVYIPNAPLMETNVEAVVDGSGEDSNGIEVELTLSIGPSTVMRRSESHNYKNHHSSGLIKKHESRKEHTDAGDEMGSSSSSSSSSTVFNRERKRSHWLFQDLSLNRT